MALLRRRSDAPAALEIRVGPRDLLGRQTLIESSSVGRRAHCHPENYIWALFPGPIKEGNRGWNAASFFLHHRHDHGHDTLFVQDSGMGGTVTPDAVALGAPPFGRDLKRYVKDGIRRTGRVVLWTNPNGPEGWLDQEGRLVYPAEDPWVLRRLREGINIGIEILQGMGALRWTPPRVLMENIRLPHLSSTCRAGVDPGSSVVDARFRAHEAENLFICDAGVLPRTTIGSLAMGVATVATFAAQRLIQDHFSEGSTPG